MDYSDNYYLFNREANATAAITGSEKYPDIKGRVWFYQMKNGVIVCTEVNGLPKGNPPCDYPVFAFHIHGGTECSGDETDAFKNAGMHYNPKNCPHPYHAGDLPPLFGADGRALSVFLTNRFTASEIIGKAIIIHSKPDDFTTQPSGNSGEKIACGIIIST